MRMSPDTYKSRLMEYVRMSAKRKLTLSVDSRVADAAKRYAAEHDTSVSQLVENFLSVIALEPAGTGPTPVLDRLRGALSGVGVADWQEHLVEKYGRRSACWSI